MTGKEQIKSIIQQYTEKGEKLYNESCETKEDSQIIGYWDGYKDCANLLLRELEDIQEETVSEDLEDAAFDYAEACKYEGVKKLLCVEHFKAGAKWQAEQFEKNRLIACDKQTEEEAEIERDFVMSIIENEHRQPTFDDAIKYGMRLNKDKMMKDAVEAKKAIIGKVRSILNKVAYRNDGLDVNGDYCEQPYVELDNEFRKLLKEE